VQVRSLLLGLTVMSALACEGQEESERHQPLKWEYLTIAGSPGPVAIKQHLDSAGLKGWELVAVTTGGAPPFQDVFYLKRPVSGAPGRR
jgi:hypothetical protein